VIISYRLPAAAPNIKCTGNNAVARRVYSGHNEYHTCI